MPLSADQLIPRLQEACAPGARGRLLDRGLARGMIWRGGDLPEGAPAFSENLSTDLLSHGFGVLGQTLKLHGARGRSELTDRGFLVAAEALEAVGRRGAESTESGFQLLVSAVSFHLARYGARAYCLLPASNTELNLSPIEAALHELMRRELPGLRKLIESSLSRNTEAIGRPQLEQMVDSEEADFEEILGHALQYPMLRALAFLEFALVTGDGRQVDSALRLTARAAELASEAGFPTLWWSSRLATPLIRELWAHSFHERIPEELPSDADQEEQARWLQLRQKFIWRILAKAPAQIDLWPSQLEAAARAADADDDLVVALPTSAGKTRIAELCILRTLAAQRRVVYVTPLRALSAQVEAGLRDVLGPLGISVSSLYGPSGVALVDVDELRASQVVVATPEKLDFSLRQAPEVLDDVGLVVLDEGHMIGEGTRKVRYEVLVQRLLRRPDANNRRLVALSAVFSSDETLNDFTAWLRSDAPGDAIQSTWRPSRQRTAVLNWAPRRGVGRLNLKVGEEAPYVPGWLKAEEPSGRRRNDFPQNAPELTIATAKRLCDDGHQTLIFAPQRRSVESLANLCLTLARQGHLGPLVEETSEIERATSIGIEWLGEEHPAVRCLELGIAVHHGRLPRPFLREVERLVNRGVLRIVIASPTIAQGLDLSCSALVFHSLYRAGNPITQSEFRNVVGRVGRAFVDLDGLVVFPVYGTNRAVARQVDLFDSLRTKETNSQLISGLLYLVDRILDRLADLTGQTSEQLSEYVLNHDGPWGEPAVENGDAEKKELFEALDELDTALLGLLEDPAARADQLAEALDEALRGSLWRRQLRFFEDHEELFERTLVGRARWLWRTTEPEERRAYYWAGIGKKAGAAVRGNIEALVASLLEAEETLAEDRTDEAVEALRVLADYLLTIQPFQPSEFPPNWEELLDVWIRGVSAVEAHHMGASEAVAFIHGGLVYRFVWALEAVRAIGLALEVPGCEGIQGLAATCVTYGVPSRQAGLLLRAGLDSRSLATLLLDHWPAGFTDFGGLRDWVEDVRSSDELEEFLESDHDRRLWDAFLNAIFVARVGEWQELVTEMDVEWDANPPKSGTMLRVDPYDNDTGEAVLRRGDYQILGRVRGWPEGGSERLRFAEVIGDPARVKITRYGFAVRG